MRTTRRGGLSPVKLKGFTELHLLVGCCYCGCEACYGSRGIAAGHGREAYELNDQARELWRRHRNGLLLVWRDPDSTPTGGGFSAAGYRGAGRWFPCFGEVVFDKVTLPKRSAAWPAVIKKIHGEIKDNLER